MADRVTVLGTGIMGSGMARSLARSGFTVTVWNRTRERAEVLAQHGIAVADMLEDAVADADVVLTMLFDGYAVQDIMTRALPAFGGDCVWVQSSTVGVAATRRLMESARRYGVDLVDAPVLGSREPAAEGRLLMLASGAPVLRGRLAPVFNALAARTLWLGDEPGAGQRAKLAMNAWIVSVIGATAQSLALCSAFGLDPAVFLDMVSDGPLRCDFARSKGERMVDGDFAPAFPLSTALKDCGLIVEAMRANGVEDALMHALGARMRSSFESGHSAEDAASVYHAFKT